MYTWDSAAKIVSSFPVEDVKCAEQTVLLLEHILVLHKCSIKHLARHSSAVWHLSFSVSVQLSTSLLWSPPCTVLNFLSSFNYVAVHASHGYLNMLRWGGNLWTAVCHFLRDLADTFPHINESHKTSRPGGNTSITERGPQHFERTHIFTHTHTRETRIKHSNINGFNGRIEQTTWLTVEYVVLSSKCP